MQLGSSGGDCLSRCETSSATLLSAKTLLATLVVAVWFCARCDSFWLKGSDFFFAYLAIASAFVRGSLTSSTALPVGAAEASLNMRARASAMASGTGAVDASGGSDAGAIGAGVGVAVTTIGA